MTSFLLFSPDFDYLEMPWIDYCLSQIPIIRTDSYSDILLNHQLFPIFLISENSSESKTIMAFCRDKLSATGRAYAVFHISDEWYIKSDYSMLYSNATFVIRNYYSPHLSHPRILQIPLGADFGYLRSITGICKKFADRSHHVFFSGQMKYSRHSMLESMQDLLEVDKCGGFQNYSDYILSLADCKFALCPNGNTTPDTYRLYESLILGCVPIVEKGIFADYLDGLFNGSCPVKSFRNWQSAKSFILDISSEDLDSYASQISIWWEDYMSDLPAQCSSFVLSSLCNRDPLCADLPFRNPFFRLNQTIWLLSIQHPSALRIRILHLFYFLPRYLLRILRLYGRSSILCRLFLPNDIK